MWPSLSNGAIDRILNGEDVPTPVLQILDCERVPDSDDECYQLRISDGVTRYSFVLLGCLLNHMAANKELEKFTIVRVNDCCSNKIQAEPIVIILLNLTVLAAGNDVNEMLGNPIDSAIIDNPPAVTHAEPATNDRALDSATTDNPSAAAPAESATNDKAHHSGTFQASQSMWPSLSTGAISKILNGEDVSTPVLQILICKNVPFVGKDRYTLLLSDGVSRCTFAILNPRLNHMVPNKELEKFTIIRVEKHGLADRKFIVLLSLTVLAAGNEVKEKLGNPVLPATNDMAFQTSTNQESQITLPSLTAGAISGILKGESVSSPILQILECKKIQKFPSSRSDIYRLEISDGVASNPYALLGDNLGHMVAKKELEQFTIVRVDKYSCNRAPVGQPAIILKNVTVLAAGNKVNVKLGNPITTSVHVDPSIKASARYRGKVRPMGGIGWFSDKDLPVQTVPVGFGKKDLPVPTVPVWSGKKDLQVQTVPVGSGKKDLPVQTVRVGSGKKDLQVQTVPGDPASKDVAPQPLQTDGGCDYCHHCRILRQRQKTSADV